MWFVIFLLKILFPTDEMRSSAAQMSSHEPCDEEPLGGGASSRISSAREGSSNSFCKRGSSIEDAALRRLVELRMAEVQGEVCTTALAVRQCGSTSAARQACTGGGTEAGARRARPAFKNNPLTFFGRFAAAADGPDRRDSSLPRPWRIASRQRSR
jgi:hypothetical protein